MLPKGLLRGNISEMSDGKPQKSTVVQSPGAEQKGTAQQTVSDHPAINSSCAEPHSSNVQNNNNPNHNLKECFDTLLKAKLNFDTKFLSFDAEFHGDVHSPLDNVKCICNICTNVKVATKRKISAEKVRKPMTKRNKRQRKANSHPKSSRIYTRNQQKSVSEPMGDNLVQFSRQS